MPAETPPAIGLSIMPRAKPIGLPALCLEDFAGFAGRANKHVLYAFPKKEQIRDGKAGSFRMIFLDILDILVLLVLYLSASLLLPTKIQAGHPEPH
jgi:hypothetical protein